MNQQLDVQGEAHEALGTAVAGYGQRVLTDPLTLGNLVADLLPDLPRERSLLVTGAEAGVAAEMRQHVEEQRIDPDTAVQLVARSLSERRAIDTTAGLWVVCEYAQALGYQVRPPAGQAAPPAPPAPPARPPGQFWQPPQPPPASPQSWPPAGAPQSWPPAGLPAQSWPPAGPSPQSGPPPGQSWPPPQTAAGGGAGRSSGRGSSGRKLGLIAAGVVAALIVVYVPAALAAHMFPFAKSRPAAAPAPVHSARPAPRATRAARSATASPSPTATHPALAAGVAPLAQLLPGGIDDPATQCKPDTPPWPWTMTGLVQALDCTDPDLAKGDVLGYQMDSTADYQATWQSFNKALGVTTANTGPTCPPPAGRAGTEPMHAAYFPYQSGQVIECLMLKTDKGPQPAYVWSLPSEDAFILAVGDPKTSFAALNTWWTTSSMPVASPSPVAS